MSEFKMQPGWVTLGQFEALKKRREAEDPDFARENAKRDREVSMIKRGDWRNWFPGDRVVLFQTLGVTAVVMAMGPWMVPLSPVSDHLDSQSPESPDVTSPDLSALQRFTPASVGMQQAKNGPYVRLSDVYALLESLSKR